MMLFEKRITTCDNDTKKKGNIMKICHVTSAHDTNDVRVFKKECTSLSKEFEVVLVGPGSSRIENNVKVIGVGNIPSNRMQRMTRFSKTIIKRAIQEDADVYHFHDPELLRFAMMVVNNGKKVVFDSHENFIDSIDEKKYLPLLLRILAKKYYINVFKKVLPTISGIVIVTPQQETDYRQLNNNIVLVPNYPIVNENDVKQDNVELRKNSICKTTLIFAGGISSQWSHTEIIKAISELNNIEYRLFGSGDESYINDLKALPGWKKVYFGGRVSYEKVQEEIEKADIALALLKPGNNTYYSEGTIGNTKLFEAMMHGKPLIATEFELWRPIISRCGIAVNPDNVDDIRQAIKKISSLKNDDYRRMGQNAQELIINKYNWSICEDRLINMYRVLMN